MSGSTLRILTGLTPFVIEGATAPNSASLFVSVCNKATINAQGEQCFKLYMSPSQTDLFVFIIDENETYTDSGLGDTLPAAEDMPRYSGRLYYYREGLYYVVNFTDLTGPTVSATSGVYREIEGLNPSHRVDFQLNGAANLPLKDWKNFFPNLHIVSSFDEATGTQFAFRLRHNDSAVAIAEAEPESCCVPLTTVCTSFRFFARNSALFSPYDAALNDLSLSKPLKLSDTLVLPVGAFSESAFEVLSESGSARSDTQNWQFVDSYKVGRHSGRTCPVGNYASVLSTRKMLCQGSTEPLSADFFAADNPLFNMVDTNGRVVQSCAKGNVLFARIGQPLDSPDQLENDYFAGLVCVGPNVVNTTTATSTSSTNNAPIVAAAPTKKETEFDWKLALAIGIPLFILLVIVLLLLFSSFG